MRHPRFEDPHILADQEYDSWRDSQLPDHAHDCARCGKWIRSCYLSILQCEAYDKELCEACRAKAAAAAA